MKIAKFAAVATTALLFGITGCSSGGDTPTEQETVTVEATPETPETSEAVPTPTPEPETPTEEPTLSQADAEAVFLEVLRTEGWFGEVPDADLVSVGYSLCGALDGGSTFDEVLDVAVSNGVPPYESGFLVGVAVSTLCPQHEAALEEWMAANGGGSNA